VPLEQALAAFPRDDMALINLGMARRATGGDGAARPVLERAVRLNPDNARATADLVNALAGSGEAERGIELGRNFLARHPGERLVVVALAYALGDAGRGADAAELFDRQRLLRVVDLDGPPPGYAMLTEF